MVNIKEMEKEIIPQTCRYSIMIYEINVPFALVLVRIKGNVQGIGILCLLRAYFFLIFIGTL